MKKFLMCYPEYFRVDYTINNWMVDNVGSVEHDLAAKQWEALEEALLKVAEVKYIDQVRGLPDMVFTANAGFKISEKAVLLSNFRNEERKPEEEHFRRWFQNHGYNVIQPNGPYEGEGDHLVDFLGDEFVGCGFRTDKDSLNWFQDNIYDINQHLELVDPRFYHLDTCFCPLIEGPKSLIWYPGAFSEESQKSIRSAFLDPLETIEVTEDEALEFVCNSIVVGKNIFMPKTKGGLPDRLTAFGYRVQQFDMSEFIKAGGACKCLVMTL